MKFSYTVIYLCLLSFSGKIFATEAIAFKYQTPKEFKYCDLMDAQFSPDGCQVAVVSHRNHCAGMIDLETGKIQQIELSHHRTDGGRKVRFSAQEFNLIAIQRVSGAFAIIDVRTAEIIGCLGPNDLNISKNFAVHPTKPVIAIADAQKGVKLLQLGYRQPVDDITFDAQRTGPVEFTQDGRAVCGIFSRGLRHQDYSCWMWHKNEGQEPVINPCVKNGGYHFAISAQQPHLAVTSGDYVNLLNVHTGEEISVLCNKGRSATFNCANNVMAVLEECLDYVKDDEYTIALWDTTDPKFPERVAALDSAYDCPNSLAFNHDGTLLVAACNNKAAHGSGGAVVGWRVKDMLDNN